MAKDATDIYGGPAKTIEVDTASNFSGAVDIGYSGDNVEIKWTPYKHTIGHGLQHQLAGKGMVTIELTQTTDTEIALVKGMRNTLYYLRVTDFNDNVYPMLVPCLWSYEPTLPFKSGEPHKIILTGEVDTDEPDDFINFQS